MSPNSSQATQEAAELPTGFTPQAERPDAETPVAVKDTGALVEADLLVEDVSIDGMCGVY